MFRPSANIRHRTPQILILHWWAFVQQNKGWIGRFCPTCGKRATDRWAEGVQDWAKSQCGMRMAIVAVLHTSGADLKFDPHIQWRSHVPALFREAHKRGELRFPSSLNYLKKYPCFHSLLNRIYRHIWYAHIGASLSDPSASVRYVGRYTKRAVLAGYRITFFDGNHVRFRFKDYAEGGKSKYKTLPVYAFIARLIRPVPDKRFPMIRHAGLSANRYKAGYLAQARRALGQPSPEQETPDPVCSSWRERQAEYTGQGFYHVKEGETLSLECHTSRLGVLEPTSKKSHIQNERSPSNW